jgi:hypothetical protein
VAGYVSDYNIKYDNNPAIYVYKLQEEYAAGDVKILNGTMYSPLYFMYVIVHVHSVARLLLLYSKYLICRWSLCPGNMQLATIGSANTSDQQRECAHIGTLSIPFKFR